MPALVALLCCVALAACAVPKVAAVTNAEFYDMIKDYIEDVEIIDTFDDQSEDIDVENDDVIALPGGPADELDVGYLIEKLGLSGNENAPRKVGFWHHHHHHHHHHTVVSCHCHRDGCVCCLTHTFSMHLGCHKFKLHACIEADYLPRDHGFRITFKINGHTLFHHEISLRHPPKLCYAVPGAERFARICLNFYNIDLRRKYICVRLTGEIDIKIKKFHVHLNLGCFKIPILKEKALAELLNDRTVVQIDAKPSDDADETISPDVEKEYESSDLADMFRQLREELEE